ncbi:MAG: hypothetical protein QF755_04250 [Candidatus Peribacteraceae bacterium]|jgi:hypothetical protein|nr:hypothetical protein [Parcubacteria group bacterium]MDP6575672.1 hypothetical protein [Candidatus Peribacteraceae bacterium]HCI03351.1 hypothetical protein [Candidatus Peribacteria bacterium]|tara:strand:- start:6955 stop:7329 length:375 start_codon:yes stop_codon:yes gene_type:complete
MEIDPHTLQQILQRIYQQMRCPQCGSRVPVDFSSVQVVADDAMLLQLKCDGCGSYIVLHASVAGSGKDIAEVEEVATANISSKLNIATDEAKMVTEALKESDGSFEKLFEKYNVGKDNNEPTSE